MTTGVVGSTSYLVFHLLQDAVFGKCEFHICNAFCYPGGGVIDPLTRLHGTVMSLKISALYYD